MKRSWRRHPRRPIEPLFGWVDDHPVIAWITIVLGIIALALLLTFAPQ